MTDDPSPVPARKHALIWGLILGSFVGLYFGSLSAYGTRSPAQDAVSAVVAELNKIKLATGSFPSDLSTLPAHLQPDIKEFNIRISADGRQIETTTQLYYDPSIINRLTLGLFGDKTKFQNPGFALDER